MTGIDPVLERAVGRDVVVTYRGTDPLRIVDERGQTQPANLVRSVAGRLALCLDADELLAELVIESDGGATFVPVHLVTGLTESAPVLPANVIPFRGGHR